MTALSLSGGRPPVSPVARTEEVHAWCARLDPSAELLGVLDRTLSADERDRAARFRFDRHRRAFSTARGFLREVLGRYLGLSPESLRFVYGPNGKPALAPDCEGGSLRFNLSHSGDLALLVVTRGREVGVDVEALRPVTDAEQIAERFFSTTENAAFLRLQPRSRLEGFFNCWTRKEAYLKALGDGLARPLDGFDVTLAPGEPARLLRVDGDPQETSRWSLRALTPAEGYVAAVVVEGHGWSFESWPWGAAEADAGTGGQGGGGSRGEGAPGVNRAASRESATA